MSMNINKIECHRYRRNSKYNPLNMSSTIITTAPSYISTGIHSQDPSWALESAKARFTKANPKSKEVFENASKHLPGGNTRTTLFAPPFPVAIVGGSGSEIISPDGHHYLD